MIFLPKSCRLKIFYFTVKEDIVCNTGQDRIVGFADTGAERNSPSTNSAATHCLQFYIRSMMSNFFRPLVLASNNIASYELTSAVWEALQKYRFTVLCVIANGMSTNRKMLTKMNNMTIRERFDFTLKIFNSQLRQKINAVCDWYRFQSLFFLL